MSMEFKRNHTGNIECSIREARNSDLKISVRLQRNGKLNSIVATRKVSVSEAKKIADALVLGSGHACNELCQSWKD
jgi:hypothetical protein